MKYTLQAMATLLLACCTLAAQSVFLNFVEKPVLLQCENGAAQPCFRLNFNFVDHDDKPVEISLPAAEQLASHLEIQIENQTVKPFYAVADQAHSVQSNRPRITLILFDISGSMLTRDFAGQSRFEGAKSAAAEYLDELADGRDAVAIVPFASRDVDAIINAARFVHTRAEAHAQLDALPAPAPRNNTALYSAVRTSVERLKREQTTVPGVEPEVLLLLLTDGSNDVHEKSGDDPDLLQGPAGLQAATDAVRASGVEVFPIGLGDHKSIDEAAMTALGTKPPLITFDLAELRRAFHIPQVQHNNRLTATLQAPAAYGSRSLLAGQVLHFRAKLTQTDGTILFENRQAPWAAPPVATPSFQEISTDAEQRALLMDTAAAHGSMLSLLRPIAVFLGLSAVLALLWFGLPRLLWPDRYDHRLARPIRPEYWSPVQRPAPEVAHFVSHPAPPGFDTVSRRQKVPTRALGDHTIVQPKTEFDPNKTRLS